MRKKNIAFPLMRIFILEQCKMRPDISKSPSFLAALFGEFTCKHVVNVYNRDFLRTNEKDQAFSDLRKTARDRVAASHN
jgi:hypothetical protein